MELKIKVNLDNAAFEDETEVSRMLTEYANDIEDAVARVRARGGCFEFELREVNGNVCGAVQVK